MAAVAESLTARKAAAEQALAGLRAERAAALLEGHDFDHDRITRAEQVIAGLEEAAKLSFRREVDARPARDAARYRTMLAQVRELEERRLAAVAQAESAAHDLAAALRTAGEAAEAEGKVAAELSSMVALGDSFGQTLQPMRHTVRLSALLAAVINRTVGAGNRFGALDLSAAMHNQRNGSEDWAECERREMTGILEAAERRAPEAKAA